MYNIHVSQNLGTIKCSNLCTEIVEYTSPDEVCIYMYRLLMCILYVSFLVTIHSLCVYLQVAVCNLASIALNRFVTPQGEFDFHTLFDVTKVNTHTHTHTHTIHLSLRL